MNALFDFYAENAELIGQLLREHVALSAAGTAFGLLVAFPMAIAAILLPRFGQVCSVLANIAQTVPSFAVLGLAIPLLGIGFAPALLAIGLRALLPIYLNTYVGLRDVDPNIREAARGIGMTRWQRLVDIELPLSLPVAIGGLRTAAVESVGIATLAAFIGGGGLGDLILQGIALRDTERLLAGALTAAALAIVVELVLEVFQRILSRSMGTSPGN